MMIRKINTKKNILIIDDDKSITQMLKLLLETRGYVVNVASTGREAFHLVSSSTDLILLDLVLPDYEGFHVCRKFKENDRTRHIPVIILSAKLLSEDIVEGLYLGADDYLTKPFEYEELVARMEAVMRRGALMRKGSVATNGEQAIIQELRKIIDQELIVPFFHPIYRLNDCHMIGLEVLSRPKTTSMLSNPELLFKAAIQFGCYQDLEMIAWKKALEYATQYIDDHKLFLNCNPYLVEGQKFLTIKSLFDKHSIKIENVVLEITERSAISDYKIFYENLKQYRDYGFKFAVDDVGGGYSSLESIVETKPEVVKIDRHIVSGLDKDKFKRSIVKFVTAFCKENKILSIAEGVETKSELDIVQELGVDAAQGYYLYRPTPKINMEEMSQAAMKL